MEVELRRRKEDAAIFYDPMDACEIPHSLSHSLWLCPGREREEGAVLVRSGLAEGKRFVV